VLGVLWKLNPPQHTYRRSAISNSSAALSQDPVAAHLDSLDVSRLIKCIEVILTDRWLTIDSPFKRGVVTMIPKPPSPFGPMHLSLRQA
jgi:hypothetical protein